MVWPGGHLMVYGMAWWAWSAIWHSLAGIPWCMVWPGEVYDSLAGIAWYMPQPGGHGMVYGLA